MTTYKFISKTPDGDKVIVVSEAVHIDELIDAFAGFLVASGFGSDLVKECLYPEFDDKEEAK